MFTILVALLSSVCAADAAVRWWLFLHARRAAERANAAPAARPLVIVPARAEGAHVAPTIASVRGADVLVVLDGADAAAEDAARKLGAEVVVKEPAGPTKAAVLAWLAAEHAQRILAADTVLLLDVGSTLSPSFFDHFGWPADADAVQAWLDGGNSGAAHSERAAQAFEDRGREAVGWNVRLRGTGSAFRPATFLAIAPRLVTRCEDREASLLLAASKIVMAPPAAVVRDEKPQAIADAAAQRARWLLGGYELFVRRMPAFASAVRHRPAEGLALLAEIFARPLSLTVPLRAVAGVWLMWRGAAAVGAAVAASTAIDVALFAGRTTLRAAMQLGASWLLALAILPRALRRWTAVRRS